jgi:hypothetical protein
MTDDTFDKEGKMRFRDLVLQIERFLKYAPKGTDLEILRREAREFDRRLVPFGERFGHSKVRKLQNRLRKICLNGGTELESTVR